MLLSLWLGFGYRLREATSNVSQRRLSAVWHSIQHAERPCPGFERDRETWTSTDVFAGRGQGHRGVPPKDQPVGVLSYQSRLQRPSCWALWFEGTHKLVLFDVILLYVNLPLMIWLYLFIYSGRKMSLSTLDLMVPVISGYQIGWKSIRKNSAPEKQLVEIGSALPCLMSMWLTGGLHLLVGTFDYLIFIIKAWHKVTTTFMINMCIWLINFLFITAQHLIDAGIMDKDTMEIISPEQIINLDETGWSSKEKSQQVFIGKAGENVLQPGVNCITLYQ